MHGGMQAGIQDSVFAPPDKLETLVVWPQQSFSIEKPKIHVTFPDFAIFCILRFPTANSVLKRLVIAGGGDPCRRTRGSGAGTAVRHRESFTGRRRTWRLLVWTPVTAGVCCWGIHRNSGHGLFWYHCLVPQKDAPRKRTKIDHLKKSASRRRILALTAFSRS